jgi:alpha-glucosidase
VYHLYSRDPVRTPMQWDASPNAGFSNAAQTWLPVHPDFRVVNVQAQMTAEASTFKLYQELIKMRKGHTFSHGDYKSAVAATSVFSYLRYNCSLLYLSFHLCNCLYLLDI